MRPAKGRYKKIHTYLLPVQNPQEATDKSRDDAPQRHEDHVSSQAQASAPTVGFENGPGGGTEAVDEGGLFVPVIMERWISK